MARNNLLKETLILGILIPFFVYTKQIFLWTYFYEQRPFFVIFILGAILFGCHYLYCGFIDSTRPGIKTNKRQCPQDVLLEDLSDARAAVDANAMNANDKHNPAFRSLIRSKRWSIWIGLSALGGVLIGRLNYQKNRLTYRLTKEGNTYFNVAPYESSDSYSDAGVLFFNKELTTLNPAIYRSYSYRGTQFCVAPLLTNPPASSGSSVSGKNGASVFTQGLIVNYFAIGMDCCSSGSFVPCLEQNSDVQNIASMNDIGSVKAGIVVLNNVKNAGSSDQGSAYAGQDSFDYIPDGNPMIEHQFSRIWGNPQKELMLMLDSASFRSQRASFEKAARSCISYYGLQVAAGSGSSGSSSSSFSFVRYTDSPTHVLDKEDGRIFGLCLFASLVGLLALMIGGCVLGKI